MHVGIVWPTPWSGTPPDIRGTLLDKLPTTGATNLRLNLDYRNPQASDLVAAAREVGFEVLPILDLDYQQPDIPAYCDFCEAIVERERFPIVEILNEPKTMEGMSARTYREIATAAATRLQRFRPSTRIAVAGDFIRFDRKGPKIDQWLRAACLPSGLFDLIAVHPYREPSAPTITRFGSRANEYRDFRRQLDGLPLIVTEVGWNLAEVSEETQAAYLYEELSINRQCGIEATYIYSMVSEQDTGMGLFRHDQTPRPAVEAVARFQREQQA